MPLSRAWHPIAPGVYLSATVFGSPKAQPMANFELLGGGTKWAISTPGEPVLAFEPDIALGNKCTGNLAAQAYDEAGVRFDTSAAANAATCGVALAEPLHRWTLSGNPSSTVQQDSGCSTQRVNGQLMSGAEFFGTAGNRAELGGVDLSGGTSNVKLNAVDMNAAGLLCCSLVVTVMTHICS